MPVMIYERIIRLLVFREDGKEYVVPIVNSVRYTIWVLSHFRDITALYTLSGDYVSMYNYVNFIGELVFKGRDNPYIRKTTIKEVRLLPTTVPKEFIRLLGDDYILYKYMDNVDIPLYLDTLLSQDRKLIAVPRNWSYIENYVLVQRVLDTDFREKYSSLVNRLGSTVRVRSFMFRNNKISTYLRAPKTYEIVPIYDVQDIEMSGVDRDYYESKIQDLANTLLNNGLLSKRL